MNNFHKKESIQLEKSDMFSWLTWNMKLIIPIYQRKYEWTDENILTLLNDIDKRVNDDHEHYFGIIAQKREIKKTNKELDKIKIIDGQQRITTSILLICAARDLVLDQKYKDRFDEISWYQNLFTNSNNITNFSEYIQNPGGTEENNQAFIMITRGKLPKDNLPKFLKNNRYYKNYQFIYDWLKNNKKSFEEIEKFIITFLYNFSVASISFDDAIFTNKKEMEIFENLNSKGLDLTIVDLIKNHLFNYCNDDLLENSQNEIPINYNKAIEFVGVNDDKIEQFYLAFTEIYTGEELKKSESKRFSIISKKLDEYLFKKFVEISSMEKFKEMILIFQNNLKIFDDINSSGKNLFFEKLNCNHIVSINSESKKRKLYFYFAYLFFKLFSKKLGKDSFDIAKFNINDLEISKKEINNIQEVFLDLTRYIIMSKLVIRQGDSDIKRNIIKISYKYIQKITFESDYSINELCFELKQEIFYLISEINLNSIYQKLDGELDNNLAKEILLLVELYMSDNIYNNNEFVSRKEPSLEHIFPEKPDEWFRNMENLDKNLKDNYERARNKLGNFLIVTKQFNTKLSNFDFDTKQEEYRKKLQSKLYKNENDKIDISNKKNWTIEAINNRTDELIKYIKNTKIFENK